MATLSECVAEITIKTLQDSPVIESLKEDIDSLYKYQEAIYIMASNPDEADLNILRAGTILAYNVIGKILNGKDPKNFAKDDWKDILDNVADYGVMMDPQKHTELVFELFATYIDFSVDINKQCVNETNSKDIKEIASEIRNMTKKLEKGDMSEADYVDRCLWSSFEAMIKLLAAYKTNGLCAEYAKFIQAVADFSVQYGRMALYSKELDLLNGYLEYQSELDVKLDDKYNNYLRELKQESDIFNDLLEHAFSGDFEQRLKSSVDIARKTGVDEKMILNTDDKIDSFFLD